MRERVSEKFGVCVCVCVCVCVYVCDGGVTFSSLSHSAFLYL